MKTGYKIENATLVPCDADQAAIVVYLEMTEVEKAEFLRMYDIDPSDLDGVFDADEVPRVEFFDDKVFVIWKHPDNVQPGRTMLFEVSSLGILATSSKIIFIVPRGTLSLTGKEFKKVSSLMDCLLRVLLLCVHHYQGHLKAIKLVAQDLQAKLVTSMENRYLLQMFSLGESLVYYHTAIEGNHTVLGKLRGAVDRLRLTAEEVELLDDVMIENQQAGKQAGIYTAVMSGLMDARGTIINNNMNVLLKNLTIINVVFLPLNLVASIGGMSEYTQFTASLDWRVSYGLLSLGMVALGWGTWWILRHVTERQYQAGLNRGGSDQANETPGGR